MYFISMFNYMAMVYPLHVMSPAGCLLTSGVPSECPLSTGVPMIVPPYIGCIRMPPYTRPFKARQAVLASNDYRGGEGRGILGTGLLAEGLDCFGQTLLCRLVMAVLENMSMFFKVFIITSVEQT